MFYPVSTPATYHSCVHWRSLMKQLQAKVVSSVFGHEATSNIADCPSRLTLIFFATNRKFLASKVMFRGFSQHPPRWATPTEARLFPALQFIHFFSSDRLPAGPQNIEKGLKVLHLSAKECVTLFCQKHFSFVILCPKTSAGSLVSSWVSGPGAFSLAWPGAVSCHQTDVSLRSMTTGRSLMSLAFINLRIRAGRYHKTDFSLISMTSKRSLTAGKRGPAD